MTDQTLYLERPSFWTEDRDPECWCRGLKVLANLEKEEGILRGTPRSLWQKSLKQVMSRRSVLGLFGMAPDREENLLLGAGFLKYNPDRKGWTLSEFARPLAADDLKDKATLEHLGLALLEHSPWVRLMVHRLKQGDWALKGWHGLRDGRGKLKSGSSLILHRFKEEEEWFSGIEALCANGWVHEDQSAPMVKLHPNVLTRDSCRDNFSWSPFKAPLYLFDYLGWLVEDGNLKIPPEAMEQAGLEIIKDGQINASSLLREITEKEADIRGFVPVEKVLRLLHRDIYSDRDADAEEFASWMDALMSRAMEKGAIEILALEPGQARHGRGLFGDRQRKLAKWIVHEDFNDCLAGFTSELFTTEDTESTEKDE